MEDYMTECKRCSKKTPRSVLRFSYDCHGIPFRLVCPECLDQIDEQGYDGAYYTEADECIAENY